MGFIVFLQEKVRNRFSKFKEGQKGLAAWKVGQDGGGSSGER